MPASFTFYNNSKEYLNLKISTSEDGVTSRTFSKIIYNSHDLDKSIGIATYSYNFQYDSNNNVYNYGNMFIKFDNNSGFPNGEDNILVLSSTSVNKFDKNNESVDREFTQQINQSLSTGEYSGQIGYSDTSRRNGVVTRNVYFPQPILTYTNAFNSLPQPSTAPLPA